MALATPLITVSEAMYVDFIQTLPCILCAGAISCVSFLDLFRPIAGVINPIMQSFLRRIPKEISSTYSSVMCSAIQVFHGIVMLIARFL